jgi:hypothetical protein
MAKILESPTGTRMIRLSGDDILTVMSLLKREFRGVPATKNSLEALLAEKPLELPEEKGLL